MVHLITLLVSASMAALGAADYNNYPVPAVCFSPCNDSMLESKAMGCYHGRLNECNMDRICRGDSAFMSILRGCRACIDVNLPKTQTGPRIYPEPEFYPYIFYCIG